MSVNPKVTDLFLLFCLPWETKRLHFQAAIKERGGINNSEL